MNKILTGLFCCALATNVNAKNQFCNFVDSFHLSEVVNNNILVTSSQSDKNLTVKIIDNRSFQLTSPDCESGYAQVTIGADEDHFCVLDIHDGPYINHPTVQASCTNLTYWETVHVKDHIYSVRISY